MRVGRDHVASAVNTLVLAYAGASLPLAAQTALQALRDLAHVGPGSAVAIHGASGGVGTLAIQVAKALGAQVTALCGAGSADLVRSLGADVVLDYRHTAPADLPGQFDCFFDVFGNQSYRRMRPRLKPRGIYVTTVPSAANLRDHVLTRLWPGRTARLVVVRTVPDLDALLDARVHAAAPGARAELSLAGFAGSAHHQVTTLGASRFTTLRRVILPDLAGHGESEPRKGPIPVDTLVAGLAVAGLVPLLVGRFEERGFRAPMMTGGVRLLAAIVQKNRR